MSDKSIIISEREILDKFEEMCAESLSPDVYDNLDKIIFELNRVRTQLQKKKVGMYGDTPTIQIGKFTISEMNAPPGKSLWFEQEEGEGAEFRKDNFEKVVKQFFDANF